MDDMLNFSVKIKNYKCFGDEEQGFECIKPINIIIGRNNSGKSTLLDLIEIITTEDYSFPPHLCHPGAYPAIIGYAPLTKEEVDHTFPPQYGGSSPLNRMRYLGLKLKWRIDTDSTERYIHLENCEGGERPLDNYQDGTLYQKRLADSKQNPFSKKIVKKIYAERNITPERDTKDSLIVNGNGEGITNIIQNFINYNLLDSRNVEVLLLNEINKIFSPDAKFIDIVGQKNKSDLWEIYLEEENKGRVPLSQSGSGLKTIIMILVFIHLTPKVERKELKEYVFCFEELENNLHPALLRRLLSYLYNIALKNKCIFFLTTHSNVEIDVFSNNKDAQIIHVTHDGVKASCRTIKTYYDNKNILNDLDIRASDLLQSNCIIWVEGPSDRIYLNRWISIWSNEELEENRHYQCVFYGGRLLSHLSCVEPDSVGNAISILSVNKNAIIIIDSDKKTKNSHINSTKKRLINEVESVDGFSWVTKGKEIENYIPKESLVSITDTEIAEQVKQFENFFDYLNTNIRGLGDKYIINKPLLAEKVCQLMTKEYLVPMLDINEKMEILCKKIRAWNNI